MERINANVRIPSWLWYSIVGLSFTLSTTFGYVLLGITLFTVFVFPSMLFATTSRILNLNTSIEIEKLTELYESYKKQYESKSQFRVLWVTIFEYNTVWIWRKELRDRLEKVRTYLEYVEFNS
jgi:hypothetical protein